MYFKSKTKSGRKYGLATCSKVDGKYDFIERAYPSAGDFGDGTLYQEPDGTAYLAYSCLRDNPAGEHVRYIYIDKLSKDYLGVEKNVYKKEIRREAPQIFKKNGVYYMITSGVTG